MSESDHQQPTANGSGKSGAVGEEEASQQGLQAARKAEKARREAKAGAGPGKGQSQAAPQQEGPPQVSALQNMLQHVHLLQYAQRWDCIGLFMGQFKSPLGQDRDYLVSWPVLDFEHLPSFDLVCALMTVIQALLGTWRVKCNMPTVCVCVHSLSEGRRPKLPRPRPSMQIRMKRTGSWPCSSLHQQASPLSATQCFSVACCCNLRCSACALAVSEVQSDMYSLLASHDLMTVTPPRSCSCLIIRGLL